MNKGYDLNTSGTEATCHYCNITLRRKTDPVGLLLAIHHHIDKRH